MLFDWLTVLVRYKEFLSCHFLPLTCNEDVTESETRAHIKIRVLLSATDIHKDLVAACGDQAPLYRTVAKWTQHFREGRETTEDDPRSGRPSMAIYTKNIAALRILIEEDNRLTIDELSASTTLSLMVPFTSSSMITLAKERSALDGYCTSLLKVRRQRVWKLPPHYCVSSRYEAKV
jgi:hypothetical protein